MKRVLQGSVSHVLALCAVVSACQGAVSNSSDRESGAAPIDGSDDGTVWCIDTRLPIHVGRCWFEMPEAPEGQSVDTDSLVLRIAGYSGDTVLDLGMDRVSDAQSYTTTHSEWYIEGTEPPSIALCPNACVFEQGGEALLWVRAECL